MSVVGIVLASDAAFAVVFGVFVLALAVLGVVAIRWGIRKDRPGRRAWRDRRLGTIAPEGDDGAPGSAPGPRWQRNER